MAKYRLNIGGEKGNAFYIMGIVRKNIPDKIECDEIITKMKSGDYNNLLRVFNYYFPMIELYADHEIGSIDSDLYKIGNPNIIEM